MRPGRSLTGIAAVASVYAPGDRAAAGLLLVTPGWATTPSLRHGLPEGSYRR